ncbi:MAG TPA: hypothetical protein VGR87_16330 [Candidatus Limnocylindria bacterium]|nr:hypothetical protein [Candidatus Limnocylindria bacterium]
MRYFLLVYDRRRHRITTHLEFPFERRDDALAQRAALVREHREDPDLEIVLLGANTFDDLKKTHSRYFKTVDQLAKQKTRRPLERVEV